MMKKSNENIRISTHTNLLKLDGIRIRYPYPVSVSGIRIRHPYPVSGIRIRYPRFLPCHWHGRKRL